MITRALTAAILALAALVTVLTGTPALAATGTPAVTGTYAQDGQACAAAYHFHHVDVTPALYASEPLWQAAWHHAWHAAIPADAPMRAAVHAYLRTGRAWSRVALNCAADDWAPAPVRV